MNVTAKTRKGWQAVKSSILQYAMSDEIPPYIDEESRSLESVPMEPQPVLSVGNGVRGNGVRVQILTKSAAFLAFQHATKPAS